MLYGILDIGSNNIKLNVYSLEEGQVKVMFSKKKTLGLVFYVEKGKLTKEGVTKLVTTLKEMKNILDRLQIEDYHFFATASLRNIKNSDDILEIVADQVGIDVDLLSGEEEGELSFFGSISTIKKDDGILIDLGGGSVEMVLFKQGKITEKRSIPVGSLKMYNEYVSGLIPTPEESDMIRKRIFKELEKTGLKERVIFMCGVGGSLRAIKKLLSDLNLKNGNGDLLDVELLKRLEGELTGNDKQTYHKILHTKPSRIHTLVPALLITDVIISYFGCKELQISEFSIREGYLCKKVLKQGTYHV